MFTFVTFSSSLKLQFYNYMQPKKNIYIPHFIRKKALRYCIRCEWVFYSVNVNHSWSSRSIKRIVTLYYFLEAFCCLTFHWNKLRPTKKKMKLFFVLQKSFRLCKFSSEFSHNSYLFGSLFPPSTPQNVLFSIGSAFLYYVNHFKLYSSFCASHSKAQKVLHPSKCSISQK